jgi:hypothetical protein
MIYWLLANSFTETNTYVRDVVKTVRKVYIPDRIYNIHHDMTTTVTHSTFKEVKL